MREMPEDLQDPVIAAQRQDSSFQSTLQILGGRCGELQEALTHHRTGNVSVEPPWRVGQALSLQTSCRDHAGSHLGAGLPAGCEQGRPRDGPDLELEVDTVEKWPRKLAHVVAQSARLSLIHI